jgi:hypothetical protein
LTKSVSLRRGRLPLAVPDKPGVLIRADESRQQQTVSRSDRQ